MVTKADKNIFSANRGDFSYLLPFALSLLPWVLPDALRRTPYAEVDQYSGGSSFSCATVKTGPSLQT